MTNVISRGSCPRIVEACRPYDSSVAPVSITHVLDRLTPDQLRDMAVALSVWAPERFEELVLEFSARAQEIRGAT